MGSPQATSYIALSHQTKVLRNTYVNIIVDVNVVSLNDIQPSRVAVGIDSIRDCMHMIRLEGVDNVL